MMRSYDALPALPLTPAGPLTAAFLRSGLSDLRQADRYLMDLPYGRISNRADLTRVLLERRGTFSSKHALFTSLAHEQGVGIDLLLAIFHMTEETPPASARCCVLRACVTFPRLTAISAWVACGSILPRPRSRPRPAAHSSSKR